MSAKSPDFAEKCALSGRCYSPPIRLEYGQADGKRRDIGIGSAKLVTLAMARELRVAVKVERRDVLTKRKGAAAADALMGDPGCNAQGAAR
jgi:hypothetical protein